jgi:hypothetical protein
MHAKLYPRYALYSLQALHLLQVLHLLELLHLHSPCTSLHHPWHQPWSHQLLLEH